MNNFKNTKDTRESLRWQTLYLTLEEKAALPGEIEEEVAQGWIVTAKAVTELRPGRSVSRDYPCYLFHRHGWRKMAPRSKNPESDKDKQEEF